MIVPRLVDGINCKSVSDMSTVIQTIVSVIPTPHCTAPTHQPASHRLVTGIQSSVPPGSYSAMHHELCVTATQFTPPDTTLLDGQLAISSSPFLRP